MSSGIETETRRWKDRIMRTEMTLRIPSLAFYVSKLGVVGRGSLVSPGARPRSRNSIINAIKNKN